MEAMAPGVQMSVTNHGALVFALPEGGIICDTGRKIVFDASAERLAMDYARKKWFLHKGEVFLLTKNQEITRPDIETLRHFRQDRGR